VTLYADLLRHGDLFLNLFRRELRVKYRGSVLGLGWTLVLPLALMSVYTVVFSVLLGAVKRLRPHGGKVSVVCVSPHIRRIFEITLLDRVFALHETLDDAQQAARSRG